VTLHTLLRDRPLDFADQPIGLWSPGSRLLVRRYAPGDEAHLDLRDDFAHAWDASGRELPPGLRWTLVNDGRERAVGGLEPLKPGVFGAWGLAADLTDREWVFVRFAARKILAYAERELGAREIHLQAAHRVGAVALGKQLGFAIARDPWVGPDGARYIPMTRSF
jgi:hypothetical protein